MVNNKFSLPDFPDDFPFKDGAALAIQELYETFDDNFNIIDVVDSTKYALHSKLKTGASLLRKSKNKLQELPEAISKYKLEYFF